MPHILLGGDLQAKSEVTQLLQQWGMTFGAWSEHDPGATWPTLLQCDAVILPTGSTPEMKQNGAGSGATPVAPILLLGNNPGFLLLSRDAQQVLPSCGPDGVDLKLALMACFEKTSHWRENENPSPEPDGFLHFLGHELRSPLTAAKTALEVLQGEIGAVVKPGEEETGSTSLQMVDIALRNIQRLHRTVDWNQSLHEVQQQARSENWNITSLEELPALMPKNLDLNLSSDQKRLQLDTSPALLKSLFEQLCRVWEFAQPSCSPKATMEAYAAGSRYVYLSLGPGRDAHLLDGHRINRTGLESLGRRGVCEPVEELRLLVKYVVSQELLDRLQVAVEVVQDEVQNIKATPCLRVRLVLAPGSPDSAEKDAESQALHASV